MPFHASASPANVKDPRRNEMFAAYHAWFAKQMHREGWPLTQQTSVPLPSVGTSDDIATSIVREHLEAR